MPDIHTTALAHRRAHTLVKLALFSMRGHHEGAEALKQDLE